MTEVLGNINLSARANRDWWRDAVVYQIYARSFADSNNDGVGDIEGIRSRLSYLSELGVDAIWITPCYDTPWNDGGYDVANYYEIAKNVGTTEQVTKLAEELHQNNMKLILDLVPNHTSSEHEWFQAALKSDPGSKEWDRYHIIKGKNDGTEPPNDWRSVFGGASWTKFPGHPGYWYLHIFDSTQPDLNWENAEVKSEFERILRFWFDRGIDGFRIDVAHGMIKDPGYPDNDVYVAMVDGASSAAPAEYPQWDRPGVHEIYRAWRKVADEYTPAKVFCAEAWVGSPERLARYIRKDELQTAFNFSYYGAGWDATKQRNAINESVNTASSVGAPTTWVLSNHDVVRHASRMAPDLNSNSRTPTSQKLRTPDLVAGAKIARAATLFMLGLPGSTYFYQGEELGLPEVFDIPNSLREDPAFARTNAVDGYRDGCRVPIPWDIDPKTNYGFSDQSAEPAWLPQPAIWADYSVAKQISDPNSSLKFYQEALRLRRGLKNLGDGSMTWIDQNSDQYLAFTRDDLVIATNTSAQAVTIDLPRPGKLLIASASGVELSGAKLTLPSDTAVWISL